MQANSAVSVRDIAMNTYETLVTRDDNMKPLLQLAASVDTSPDNRVFTFKLRQGVHFHNGKLMTSADVRASFERYTRVGIDRSILAPVDHFDTPDPATFVITLKDQRPTFIESMSSITVPIIIFPEENKDAPPQQLPSVGTGPYQMVQFVPDGFVKLKRFDGYSPDTRYTDIDGFGGYKVACLDTVTFRMVPEGGARVAGLETGELQAVEDVPTIMQKRIAANKDIKLVKLDNFWLNVAYGNWSAPPTDNVKFRQAVLAALDFDELMEAANDGNYKHNYSLQYPGSTYYTEAGRDLLNQHNPEKAKALLKEAGYHGEKVVLLTNKDYPALYNTALVFAQQLQAVGINAQMLVLDWPTALAKSMKGTPDWNFFFTGWITYIAQGGMQTLRPMAEPNPVYTPPGGQDRPRLHGRVRYRLERCDAGGAPGRLRQGASDRADRRDGDPDGRDAESAGRADERRALPSILRSTDVQCVAGEIVCPGGFQGVRRVSARCPNLVQGARLGTLNVTRPPALA